MKLSRFTKIVLIAGVVLCAYGAGYIGKNRNTLKEESAISENGQQVKYKEQITPESLFLALNVVRRENGLSQLGEDPLLRESSKMKCDDMVKDNYYAHINPNTGKSGNSYVIDTGARASVVSENLNRGVFYSSSEVIENWMKSNSHKAAILNPKFTETGFAVCTMAAYPGEEVYVNHFMAPAIESEVPVRQSVTCTHYKYDYIPDQTVCR